MSVIGVLLAAGRGRRLGGHKQLSPWPSIHGTGTLISSAFDHISVACDEIILVLGHRQDDIEEALRPRVYSTIRADADVDMSKSVKVGLEVALRVEGVQCILLQLGDHPHVSPSTLEGIIASALERGTAIAPRYQGRNGHPIAIPTRVARSILEAEMPGGLADWFRADACRRNFVDVDDPSVVMDIDTPGDLERAAELTTQ